MAMRFSIIITTRNRPDTCNVAIESVLRQNYEYKEVIVVEDGSASKYISEYKKMLDGFAGRIRVIVLETVPQGHGHGYAINRGVDVASGDFLAILDDDDEWIDSDHLSRAAKSLSMERSNVDLYFSMQEALGPDGVRTRGLWLNDLASSDSRLRLVSVSDLISNGSFCHLNTTIISRDLFNRISGMDERLRWEVDHDFYLRSIDAADGIMFAPYIIARHQIPVMRPSISVALSTLQKLTDRLHLLEKAILFSKHRLICEHARLHKSYTLREIAEILASSGQFGLARVYASEALGLRFGFKWATYTAYLAFRSLVAPRVAENSASREAAGG